MNGGMNRRGAVKTLASLGALGAAASEPQAEEVDGRVFLKGAATGNWLMRGETFSVIRTDPEKVMVMITNVIGDTVRINIIDVSDKNQIS